MKSKALLTIAVSATLLVGCSLGKTRYEVRYCFDNTEIRSDFLEVYECTADLLLTGKWRSCNHHLDTVKTEDGYIEWASGFIKDVANDGCVALKIITEGYRPTGGGNFEVDSVYHLVPGELNLIYITPSIRFNNRY